MKEFIYKQVKEVGLGIAAFCLMSWMVVNLTNNLVDSMDSLRRESREFTTQVKNDHSRQLEAQRELMTQHREITASLGRINGYRHD